MPLTSTRGRRLWPSLTHVHGVDAEMLGLGRAQRVGGRHPELHLPVELEQPARHRAAVVPALCGAARLCRGSAPAAVTGGSGTLQACQAGWEKARARRGGRGQTLGPVSPPKALPGKLQRDAGGEVAVGSRLPLARQPVVAEVQDAAEVEGLRRRVWERGAGKNLSEAPVPAAEEPQPPPCPAAKPPSPNLPCTAAGHWCTGTWPGTAPKPPPPAIGHQPLCGFAQGRRVSKKTHRNPGARLHRYSVHLCTRGSSRLTARPDLGHANALLGPVPLHPAPQPGLCAVELGQGEVGHLRAPCTPVLAPGHGLIVQHPGDPDLPLLQAAAQLAPDGAGCRDGRAQGHSG